MTTLTDTLFGGLNVSLTDAIPTAQSEIGKDFFEIGCCSCEAAHRNGITKIGMGFFEALALEALQPFTAVTFGLGGLVAAKDPRKNKIVGITTTSAIPGKACRVIYSGLLTNPAPGQQGWMFAYDGLVYVQEGGAISATESDYPIGFAVATNSISVRLDYLNAPATTPVTPTPASFSQVSLTIASDNVTITLASAVNDIALYVEGLYCPPTEYTLNATKTQLTLNEALPEDVVITALTF